MQQLRHSNAGATTNRRGTVQRATKSDLDDGTNEEKYITPKLASSIRGFIRTQNPPAAANAKKNIGYIETNADDLALAMKIKSYRKAPFFAVRAADLGGGHRGYSASGYSRLGTGLAVNAGGTAGYAGLGAINEQFNSMVSANFGRVGSYTFSYIIGLAAGNNLLYILDVTNRKLRVRGINPETGAVSFTSGLSATVSSTYGALTVVGNFAYAFGLISGKIRVVKFSLNSTTVTTLSTSHNNMITSPSLASIGSVVYALQFGSTLYTINTTNGARTLVGSITGISGTVRSMASLNNLLYIVTNDKLYEVDPNGSFPFAAIEQDNVSPENATFVGLSPLNDFLYAYDSVSDGIYKVIGSLGNRWSVLLPTGSAEVADDDEILKLFTSPGATEITLNRRSDITDAIAFVSDFDGASAHTVSVGQNLNMALYNSDNEQLYEGANEAVYAEIPLQEPTQIGV